MKLTPQFIEQDGKPVFVVLSVKEWKRLVELAEDAEDIRAYDEAKASDEETFPSSLVDALLDGGNRVKLFREHRGLTQARLAKAAGITQIYVSQIESGKRRGSAPVLRAIARAMKVDLELLVPPRRRRRA